MPPEPLESQEIGYPHSSSSSVLSETHKSSELNSMSKIQNLYYELLVAILHLSLPPVDVGDRGLSPSDPCPQYVTALYSLRSICGLWRSLIDETPCFWSVVCAALPMEVNSAFFAKSGQSHLTVHCSEEARVDQFMELDKHHRNRWVTAAFQLPASYMATFSGYLGDPAPKLQSLTFLLPGSPLDEAQHINLLGGETQNIRSLSFHQARIQWLPNAFTGLKRLILSEIRTQTGNLTSQYIVDILACSASLETLDLNGVDVLPTPIEGRSPPLHLPLLTALRLRAVHPLAADYILRCIIPEPGIVTQLHIELWHHELLFDPTRFLSETLPPYAALYKHVNARCDGSTLQASGVETLYWTAQNGKRYRFLFHVWCVGFLAGLQWMADALVDEWPGVCLRLNLTPGIQTAFSASKTSRIVTGIEIPFLSDTNADRTRLDMALDAVSGLESGDDLQTSEATAPSFPVLRAISFVNFMGGLDRIEQALQR
ncbi:hypothetical protein FS837_003316, partial [Tulasnella sp. UAMH 9824]